MANTSEKIFYEFKGVCKIYQWESTVYYNLLRTWRKLNTDLAKHGICFKYVNCKYWWRWWWCFLCFWFWLLLLLTLHILVVKYNLQLDLFSITISVYNCITFIHSNEDTITLYSRHYNIKIFQSMHLWHNSFSLNYSVIQYIYHRKKQ